MIFESDSVSDPDGKMYSVNFAEFSARGEKRYLLQTTNAFLFSFSFVLTVRKFSAKFCAQLHKLPSIPLF